jgi:basic amino acid/polyamine antiporter, APA family
MNRTVEQLRGLSLWDTTALVVGTVIGSGVFLKAAPMMQAVGTPWLVLAAWVAAGLLSLAGALTYAELGAMLPEAGGEYVYLKKSYGSLLAFLFGWQRFIVAGSASIATLGVGVAIFLSNFLPLKAVWLRYDYSLMGQSMHWQFGAEQVVAVSVILIMTSLNCLTVVIGGRIQTLLTLLKVGGILFIIVGVLTASPTASWSHLSNPEGVSPWSGFSLFGAAMLAALWGYDGWNNMPMAAGEVRNPGRNIPLALISGMLIVMFVYCMINLCYFYALTPDEVRTSRSTEFREALPVASKAANSFMGEAGGKLVSIIFVISAIGALNGSILSNARVPFAMARDGLFFSPLAKLSPNSRVPVTCLIVQSVWASVLALSGTFDQLTDCLLFAAWIFYALVTSSIFVLRRKLPNAPRPYRTFGYPYVPILFIVVAVSLIVNTLMTKRVESVVGLVLIGAGLPLFFLLNRRNQAVS